ncbi:MAG: SdpI family protein [Syntrophomonadaceae bacterium]|jgi:uncharacterized membrane protein
MEKSNNGDNYRLDWGTLRREWPLWVLLLGLLVSGIIVYPHLPPQVPGHWNIHGEVDAYYSRQFGAFFVPLMTVGIYLLMLFIPMIDPRRENYVRFSGAYTFLRWALVLFFTVLYLATILIALGYTVDVALIIKAMVAVLLIVTGNYMGQFRHNYFVGIRTPWTLANEEVWQQTHRMGAKIWVAGGLVCLVMAPIKSVWAAYVFFTSIMIMTLVPIVYSYILFKKKALK